jgi:hypothetical protein
MFRFRGVDGGNFEEWSDTAKFSEDKQELGEELACDLAKVVNTSFRTSPKKEKMQDLFSKHKRPKNVKNLQVLKVDEILWKQQKPQTKSYDYGMQQTQTHLCLALVPTLLSS